MLNISNQNFAFFLHLSTRLSIDDFLNGVQTPEELSASFGYDLDGLLTFKNALKADPLLANNFRDTQTSFQIMKGKLLAWAPLDCPTKEFLKAVAASTVE